MPLPVNRITARSMMVSGMSESICSSIDNSQTMRAVRESQAKRVQKPPQKIKNMTMHPSQVGLSLVDDSTKA